jgi:cell division protein FtsQ
VRLSLAPVTGRWQTFVSRLIAALLLVTLGWATYAIFDSPNFYAYGAQVQGNAVVSDEEVYAASGLEGLSTFWIDPEKVSTQVEALPNVRSAQVKVRIPARVTITVEERNPELIWQTGETRWWVDAEGTFVPPRADLSNALIIVDIDAQPVAAGQALDPTILEAAISLHRLLPDLKVLHFSRTTGISFKTREGWPVYLGDGKNMRAKLTILVTLYNDLLTRGVSPEFIDIRFVERPFYK